MPFVGALLSATGADLLGSTLMAVIGTWIGAGAFAAAFPLAGDLAGAGTGLTGTDLAGTDLAGTDLEALRELTFVTLFSSFLACTLACLALALAGIMQLVMIIKRFGHFIGYNLLSEELQWRPHLWMPLYA